MTEKVQETTKEPVSRLVYALQQHLQHDPNEMMGDITRLEGILLDVRAFLFQRSMEKPGDKLSIEFFTNLNSVLGRSQNLSKKMQLLLLNVHGLSLREQKKQIITKRDGTFTVKYVDLPLREQVLFLNHYITFARIGEQDEESTPLFYYNFDTGIYSNNIFEIDLLINAFTPNVTLRDAIELRRWISFDAPYKKSLRDENISVLGNGLYNIKTKQLLPFSPQHYITSKANTNWNPSALHPVFPDGWRFDNFIKEQAESIEDEKMLWQTIQYTLLTTRPKNVIVFLFDQLGNTGKGTFARMLENLLGIENVGAANINALNDKFSLASVYLNSLIVGDENDNTYIQTNEVMKTLATGDPIRIEPKGKPVFKANPTPMILQLMNSTPKFKHMDNGSKRRIRISEFKHTYSGQVNHNVKLHYIANQQLLEWIVMQALSMPFEDFIDSPKSQQIKGEIERESNPVAEWLEERFSEYHHSVLPIELLFADFLIWLRQQNKTTNWTRKTFTNNLKFELDQQWEYIKCRPISKRIDDPRTPIFKNDYELFYKEYLQNTSNVAQPVIFLSWDTQKLKYQNSLWSMRKTQ